MKTLDSPTYDPNRLLDEVLRIGALKNDAALSRAFGIAPPVISKYRHRKLAICDSMILRIHEIFGMPISMIKELGGIPKRRRNYE